MKLTIEIELDNAAFDENQAEEVARILEDLSQRLPEGRKTTSSPINLRDSNGNWVGQASIA